jgi:hypothetical protein
MAVATANSKKLLAPIKVGGTGDTLDAEPSVKPIGKPRVEIRLDQDRHRKHGDHERLPHDLLALQIEQHHERQETMPRAIAGQARAVCPSAPWPAAG